MQTSALKSITEISHEAWNALLASPNPFLRHEFLAALERNGCVGARTGWLPHHIVCHDDSGKLAAAAPMYVKTNSYGEFVFDWSWAEAYERHGLRYYPKLVSAIPFTPASGQRLLIRADAEQASVRNAIIEHALEDAKRLGFSSLHWLFTTEDDTQSLCSQGFLRRMGCQFHWNNDGYRDFSDFLESLTSKRRKNIKRERRLVYDARLDLRSLSGCEVTESEWRRFHEFYCSTFERLGGIPTLTLPFFLEIGSTMGEQILLVLASSAGVDVATAISFRSEDTLYGRHWGCAATYDSLHFEACYYQGIEFCIANGLRTFEPGAQGEHKVFRGFMPTLTQSAHWLAHSGFRGAITEFLDRESVAIKAYAKELTEHSSYRQHTATR